MARSRNHCPAKPLHLMTVIAKSKLGASRIGRHREGRRERVAGRGDPPSFTEYAQTATAQRGTAARRRREAGAPQDQAVYSCSCGFVFEAQVSTSVGCPHCGGTQAW